MFRGILAGARVVGALATVLSMACAGASRPPGPVEATGAPAAPAGDLRVLGERSLEGTPTDLRWDGESLLVADVGRGLLQVSWETKDPPVVVAPNEGRFHRWLLLGSSDGYRAGSFGAFGIWWSGPGGEAGEYAIEFPGDLDVHGDRLLTAGLRRDDDGLAADGFIAWTARLGDELRPVLPAHDGVGAPSMLSCAALKLPRVKFLPDGRFVIAAGSEPGIQLYSSEGRLEAAWEAVDLGIDFGCPMSPELAARMGTDEEARVAWWNQHRLVDEILPTPDGFALLVRYRESSATHWELVQPELGGDARRSLLPFSHPSNDAHLAADVLDGRAAFLLTPSRLDPDFVPWLTVTTWPF